MPFERLKKLNTKDCLWIYILRILREKDTHAYTLRETIKSRYGFQPGIMTAYKVLYLLERRGLVKQTREGRKRIYSITPKGKSELKKAGRFYQSLAKTLA